MAFEATSIRKPERSTPFRILNWKRARVPPVLTTFAGKFVVTFTITVNSTIAATAKIGCQVDANLDDITRG